MTFHLIDLISQCAAVERFLADSPEDEKIAWLAVRGFLRALPGGDGREQVYRCASPTGLEACFFLSAGRFVFVGDPPRSDRIGRGSSNSILRQIGVGSALA